MSRWKLAHVYADLGDQTTSCHMVNAWNTLPELDELSERCDPVVDLLFNPPDSLV
jgi:hypothetical protein